MHRREHFSIQFIVEIEEHFYSSIYINYLTEMQNLARRRYKLTVIMNRTIIFSNYSPSCRQRCRCRRLWCQTLKFLVNFCFVWFWFCHKHLFRAAELHSSYRHETTTPPTEGAIYPQTIYTLHIKPQTQCWSMRIFLAYIINTLWLWTISADDVY